MWNLRKTPRCGRSLYALPFPLRKLKAYGHATFALRVHPPLGSFGIAKTAMKKGVGRKGINRVCADTEKGQRLLGLKKTLDALPADMPVEEKVVALRKVEERQD